MVLVDDDEQVVELVSAYLISLSNSALAYSPETISLYAKHLRHLCAFLATDSLYSKMSIDDVLASMPGGVIDQYLASLAKRGLQASTIRNRDVALKGFFEWLTTAEAGRARQTSGYERGLKSSPSKRKMPRFVTAEQLVALMSAVNHESQRCVLHLIYDVGLRVSEVPRLTRTDFDLLAGWPEHMDYLPLLVLGSKGRGPSHVRERYSLISRTVYARVRRYHSTPSYRFKRLGIPKPAFLNTKGEPITARCIQKLIADARKRIGGKFQISAHRLRHGAALSFLRGELGRDYLEKLVIIQTQLGHSSVKSTESYAHIPAALFTKLNANEEVRTRIEEAQRIYDATYLPAKAHRERRGRPIGR